VLDRVALDLDKRVETAGTRHALAYGAAWQQRDIDFSAIDYRWNNAGVLDTATVDASQVPGTEATAWNLYLQDRIGLLEDRLLLTLGARYDRYDYSPRLSPTFQDPSGTVRDVSFASPTWQSGISYRFLPQQTLWFQAGRGFRAPTTGEMYAPTSTTQITEVGTGNTVVVPTSAANPELDAETSLNLELGWRWESDRARVGVSVFRDRYDDFIESVPPIRRTSIRRAPAAPAPPASATTTTRWRTWARSRSRASKWKACGGSATPGCFVLPGRTTRAPMNCTTARSTASTRIAACWASAGRDWASACA